MIELTQEQKDIIDSNKRFNFIMAGAGCGKTSTILELIKHKQTNRFFYITFTTQMIKEVRQKISNDKAFDFLTPTKANFFTFNSAGMSLAGELDKNVKFYQNKNEYHKVLFEMLNKDIKTSEDYECIELKEKINSIESFWNKFDKYKQYYLKNINDKVEVENQDVFDMLQKRYNDYWEYIDQENYFYQNMPIYDVDYILIDEYQDLDSAKFEIIKKLILTHPKTKFYFVGDFNQQIYSFKEREISGDYFTKTNDFCKNIDEADIGFFTLSQCFRCDNRMISLANEIISQNKIKGIIDSQQKMIWAPMQHNTRQINFNDGLNQWLISHNWVESILSHIIPEKSNLIITRKNNDVFNIQKQLFLNGIRYSVSGNNQHFFSNYWKDGFWVTFVLHYLHLEYCPKWIINKLYASLISDITFINSKNKDKLSLLPDLLTNTAYCDFLSFVNDKITKYDLSDIKQKQESFVLLKEHLKYLQSEFDTISIEKNSYRHFVLSQMRTPNNTLSDVIDFIVNNSSSVLAEYINDCFLDRTNVLLSTIHGVKGIEKENVILLINAYQKEKFVSEEDRRIWYVAYTRSKHSFVAIKKGQYCIYAFEKAKEFYERIDRPQS